MKTSFTDISRLLAWRLDCFLAGGCVITYHQTAEHARECAADLMPDFHCFLLKRAEKGGYDVVEELNQ